MANFKIQIDSISGGHAPTLSIGSKNQYQTSVGIDPDFPALESSEGIGGILRPVSYEDFSGANVNAEAVNLVTTPENALLYAGLSNGRLVSYDNFASETLVTTSGS